MKQMTDESRKYLLRDITDKWITNTGNIIFLSKLTFRYKQIWKFKIFIILLDCINYELENN